VVSFASRRGESPLGNRESAVREKNRVEESGQGKLRKNSFLRAGCNKGPVWSVACFRDVMGFQAEERGGKRSVKEREGKSKGGQPGGREGPKGEFHRKT